MNQKSPLLYFETAIEKIIELAERKTTIELALEDAFGKVLAEPVYADRDYPPFNRVAMDGIAVKHEDLTKGIRSFKMIETVFAGSIHKNELQSGECYRIMTGASLPNGADVVIPIENLTIFEETATYTSEKSLPIWTNIAKKGEDYPSGKLVLEAPMLIDHSVYGLLATVGMAKVVVYQPISIVLITTGDELVMPGEDILPHQIRNSNRFVLEGLMRKYAFINLSIFHVKDDKKALENIIRQHLDKDVLLFTGGVSMGDADYLPEVLNNCGVEKIFHKTAIKPGKPVWFGKSKTGVVFGLPGNPLSSQITFKLFVEPYLLAKIGISIINYGQRTNTSQKSKKGNLDQFYPAKQLMNGDVAIASFNGSGDISACVGTNGFIWHPAEIELLNSGDSIRFYPW